MHQFTIEIFVWSTNVRDFTLKDHADEKKYPGDLTQYFITFQTFPTPNGPESFDLRTEIKWSPGFLI